VNGPIAHVQIINRNLLKEIYKFGLRIRMSGRSLPRQLVT
jgi:hypothetical protein